MYPFHFTTPGVGNFAEEIDVMRQIQTTAGVVAQRADRLVGERDIMLRMQRDMDRVIDFHEENDLEVPWSLIVFRYVFKMLAAESSEMMRHEGVRVAAILHAMRMDHESRPTGDIREALTSD